MYEEDMIFGPLTFKQFIALALFLGPAYYLYASFENDLIIVLSIFLTLVGIVAAIRLRPKKIPLSLLKEYLEKKKRELPREKFERMIQRKIAEALSQTSMLTEKGLLTESKAKEFVPIMDILNEMLPEEQRVNISKLTP